MQFNIDTRRTKDDVRDKPHVIKSGDYGPLSFKSKVSKKAGSIMTIASTNVVTIPPTMTIKGAIDTMTKYRFRRLPVVDAGTNRLIGIIGSSDIIEFLGGGDKAKLLLKKHNGNFLASINDSVREIMATDVITVDMSASIEDALSLILNSRIGGVVIVDDENRVKGIVTERDFVFLLAEKVTGKKVEDYMTRNVITVTPGTRLGDACKIMVRNSFRRLPVVSVGFLEGILTTRMIINFLGKNEIFEKIKNNSIEDVLNIRVSEIMSKNVPTVTKDKDLGDVARIMEETGFGTVCVVEDGKLIGILTERDIVRALAE